MKWLSFLVLCLPITLFAQSGASSNDKIDTDCDGRIFTRVQEPAKLSISQEDFTDSIVAYLKSKKVLFSDRDLFYSFILTKNKEITSLFNMVDNSDIEKDLEDALLKYAHLWLPAKQNTVTVCMSVKCRFTFHKKKLVMKILS